MKFEEARELLVLYGAGRLTPAQTAEFEALLAKSPELQKEVRMLKEEDELLSLALNPLRAGHSTRLRLSAAMADAYNQTTRETDKALTAKPWRMTKVLLVLLLVGLICIFIVGLIVVGEYRHRQKLRQNQNPGIEERLKEDAEKRE